MLDNLCVIWMIETYKNLSQQLDTWGIRMYTTNSCPSNINQKLLSHGLQDETSTDLGVVSFSQGDPEFWASYWSLVDFNASNSGN
jgi:hypothetical protein